MAPNADIQGLSNLFRQFMTSQRSAGTTGGIHPFGPPAGGDTKGDLPSDWMDELRDITKGHTDGFKKVTEDHTKGFKSVADEFWSRGIKAESLTALPQALIRETLKYSFFQGYQIQGGTAGDSARGSLERLNSAGNIMAIAAGTLLTVATVASGGTLGGAAALGGALTGGMMGTGIATRIAAASRTAKDVTVEAEVIKQFQQSRESKVLQYEQSLMMHLMGARTGSYAANLGVGGPVMDKDMIKRTLLSEQEFTAAWVDAARAGGAKGMDMLSKDMKGKGTIARMWEQGLTGPDFAQTMVMAATSARYGMGADRFEGMTRRTGLQPSEWLGAAMGAQTRYHMFGANVGANLAYGVGGTELGRMNMGAGMGFLAQMGQGSAGQQDEAVSMLQYRNFLEANPGSSYLDFVEAKRNGEADPRWRRAMGAMAGSGAGGGWAGLAAATQMGIAPGQVGRAGQFLAQMERGGNAASGQTGVPQNLAGMRDTVGESLSQVYNLNEKQMLLLSDNVKVLDSVNEKTNEAIDKMKTYNDTVILGTDNINNLNKSFFQMIDSWAERMYKESGKGPGGDTFTSDISG